MIHRPVPELLVPPAHATPLALRERTPPALHAVRAVVGREFTRVTPGACGLTMRIAAR